MQDFEVEFNYLSPENGNKYRVLVLAIIEKSVSNPDSDWEAKDHIDIESVEVWQLEGEPEMVDIPEEQVYAEISAQIRAAELTRAFNEEDGGF